MATRCWCGEKLTIIDPSIRESARSSRSSRIAMADLLLSLLYQETGGHSDTAFRFTDVVLIAWNGQRETFGLPHNSDYPDSHRVITELCRINKRGWSRNIRGRGEEGGALYQLTSEGIERAKLVIEKTSALPR